MKGLLHRVFMKIYELGNKLTYEELLKEETYNDVLLNLR